VYVVPVRYIKYDATAGGAETNYWLCYVVPSILRGLTATENDEASDIITFRASYGTVYCNRSCLFVCVCVCVCLWVCYHDNSKFKLRASILTKLGL